MTSHPFGAGWRFGPASAGSDRPEFDDSGFAAVTLPQEFYAFGERDDLLLFVFPLACCRFLSLAIKAVLRASSCARSLVEAGDKLPVPVLDKSGSGL